MTWCRVGVPPAPNPPHSIRPDRPRSSAKGRGLPFRGHRYAVGSELHTHCDGALAGGLRRRIEVALLPDEPVVRLLLDRAARLDRDRRRRSGAVTRER